jgi:cyclopropane-fatty-acyl-phospholipid synthase
MRLNAWIEKRIFPGAYPPTLKQIMNILEPYDLAVLDVENLRLHYAKTAEQWLARFEQSRDRVAAMFDDRFVRAWRLYLAGTTAAFTTSSMQLFQVAFARARHNGIPWTRAHLYQ